MQERFRTCCSFILKNLPSGEYDAHVTILTKEYGKMRTIGRGALSPKSRRRTALQPFTKSTILLERHHEQWYIREAHIEQNLSMTPETEKKIHFIGQIFKVLDKLIPYETPEGHSREFFGIVEETYMIADHLSTITDTTPRYLLHIICAKILATLGFFPDFSENTNVGHAVLQKIHANSCTTLITQKTTLQEQAEIMKLIGAIYRNVVTDNTSGTVPMRSMTMVSSS